MIARRLVLAPAHGRAIAAMALGGLLFGFDTAVIAGATTSLRHVFGLDAAGLGALVSAALWGTLVGAVASGAPGDRWGARAVLRVIGVLYLLSAETSRAAPFWLFAGAMLFQAALVAAVFPETMRRSLEDISGALAARR